MLVVEKCKEKKEKLHLTYAQIAEMSGIPLSTVSAFFTGTSQNPTYITVGAMCRILGVSLDAIIGIEDDEMSADEISRVREESAANEERLQKTIQEHAKELLLNEATIKSDKETIRRQDLRMQELKDRIAYQKRAIFWLRVGIAAAIIYGLIMDFMNPALGIFVR